MQRNRRERTAPILSAGFTAIAVDLETRMKWFQTDSEENEIPSVASEDSRVPGIRADAIPALQA